MARRRGKVQDTREHIVTEDRPLLEKFHKWLQGAIDDQTWVAWRKNAIRCFQYRENEQESR